MCHRGMSVNGCRSGHAGVGLFIEVKMNTGAQHQVFCLLMLLFQVSTTLKTEKVQGSYLQGGWFFSSGRWKHLHFHPVKR